MDDDKMLARFGISSGLAYGLLVQSILVIGVTIISIWGIFEIYQGFTINYITNIISFLVCISLLVYSFYGFNAKNHQESFFAAAIILYIILTIFVLFTTIINIRNPVTILSVISLVSIIFFFREYKVNYKAANYAMLIVLISNIILLIINVMGGMPWFVGIKYIIIPVTIGLTYFERVQRGKYDFEV